MADRRLAWALVAVIVRYLTTIQPQAKRELARWRHHALAIPDSELRAHVLRPFDSDGSALGASLFAVLAPLRMQRRLVRLLIAYVLLWSYVDVCTERDPDAEPRLHDALVDALQPRDTTCLLGGCAYLAALVSACRRGCAALPSWHIVQPTTLRLADDGRTVQAINHGPPSGTETRLRTWASGRSGRPWQEQCAAASSPLAIHALMALGAQPSADIVHTAAVAAAYEPVSALGVLCDHLIDRCDDQALANHSYVRYVDSTDARMLGDLADRCARSVSRLPSGQHHAVILAAMVAMFLAGESASSTDRTMLLAVRDALGPPARVLHAILRTQRRRSRRARGDRHRRVESRRTPRDMRRSTHDPSPDRERTMSTSAAPLVTGVDFINVPVTDLDASRAWYRDVLGLKPSQVYQRRGEPAMGAEFENGTVTIALIDVAKIGREFQAHSMPIAFRVDDVAAARAALEEQGVEFQADTLDSGVCHMAFFADPDGNALMLHHRYAPRD